MEIYVYLDGPGFDEVAGDVSASIEGWIASSKSSAVLVAPVQEEAEEQVSAAIDSELGIRMNIRKGRELKEPLNFLNKVAKKNKCVFVFGVFDSDTGAKEDICYFGYEEANPDLYEISTYIGIKV